jgi:leucyl aminopeptidase
MASGCSTGWCATTTRRDAPEDRTLLTSVDRVRPGLLEWRLKLSLVGIDDLGPSVPRVLPVKEAAVPAAFAAAARAAGFTGKPDQTLLLPADPASGDPYRELLLLGLGDRSAAEAAGARAAAALSACREIAIDGRGLPRSVAVALALGAAGRSWRFPEYRQGPPETDASAMQIERLSLVVDDPGRTGARWRNAVGLVEAMGFARTLIAEPSNLLTPRAFIQQLGLLEAAGVAVEVISAEALSTEGLHLLAAVGRGSVNPPALAVLHWPGRLPLPPVVFVGKGMTFDTGGISIKPADRMWEMRGDMTGAAVCAGAMLALARRNSPAPVAAVLPLAENMIGSDAYRPGDIVRSHHGLTVEIVDTDAEGRLILADALSFAAARFHPRAMVDLATLTDSVGVALGREMAGLYANDPVLAAHLAAAGVVAGEPVWRMPYTEGQREQLVSEIADIKQCLTGQLLPDASLGAAFLSRFVGETPWAHIDIGGTDLREEADERHAAGPTGFGVRLLDRLIALRYEDPDHP